MTESSVQSSNAVLKVIAWVLLGVAVILLIVTVVSYAHAPHKFVAASLGLPIAVTVAALAAAWFAFGPKLWTAATTGIRVRNIILGVVVTFILIPIGTSLIDSVATWIAGLF
jgi:hypothetical protein